MVKMRVITLVVLIVMAFVCIGSVFADTYQKCTICNGYGVRICTGCRGTGKYAGYTHSYCKGTGYIKCGGCNGQGGYWKKGR